MAGGDTTGSARGGGLRARDAIASAPAFRTPLQRASGRMSQRLIGRYAPDGAGARRSRSLGHLGFADRLLMPYVQRAQEATSPALRHGSGDRRGPERRVPEPSWLFPYPWYQDELDWIEASRRAPLETAGGVGPARRAMAAPVGLPHVMPSPAARRPVAARAPRAWSPLVAPAALEAAEVFAGAMAFDARRREAPPVAAPAMEWVAPRDLVDAPARRRAARALSAGLQQRDARPPAPQPPGADTPSTAAPPARWDRDGAPTEPPGTPEPSTDRPVPARPPSRPVSAVELLARGLTSPEPAMAPAAGPRLGLPVGLGGLITALDEADQVSRPLSPARAEPTGAVDPPVAAPGSDRPMVVAPSAPAVRSPGVHAARPPALEHVAWADRWLARFAGASQPALATLEPPQRSGRSLRAVAAAPGPVFLAPDAPPAIGSAPAPPAEVPTTGAPARSTAASRPRVDEAAGPTPREAPRIDDDEAVSDEMFAAIARAAVAPRDRPPTASRSPGGHREEPTAPSRPPLAPAGRSRADRLLSVAVPPSGAGLSASLTSSPVAAALASVLGVEPSSPFDPRVTSFALASAAATGEFSPALVTGPVRPRFDVSGPGSEPRVLAGLASGAPARELVAPAETVDVAFEERGDLAPVPGSSVRSAAGAPPTEPVSGTSAAPVPGVHFAGATGQPWAIGPTTPPTMAGTEPALRRFSGRPGGLAEMARTWSVEQEQGSADLAFDFVAPELVMAARTYGFGPVEAAQAARLAAVGRSGLSSLAAAVDLTFVHAAQAETERQPAVAAAAGASSAAPSAPPSPTAPAPTAPASPAAPAPLALPRRTPRGAFLWPEATARALGFGADERSSGGDNPLALAALDLLAAHVVAEAGMRSAAGEPAAAAGTGAATEPPPGELGRPEAGEGQALPSEFEPIYLALSRSPAGRSLSPTVRAARALALARRSSRDSGSARTRAAAAWAVMPMVLTGGIDEEPAPGADTRAPAAAEAPGARLAAARAGESLRSLVAPVADYVDEAEGIPGAGAVGRAPSAAPELVRTGPTPTTPAPQATGGGEETLPPWFEEAARKAFQEQSGDQGMSIAEMTLVTAAPVRHVAASPATANQSPAPAPPEASGGDDAGGASLDLEEMAEELYAELRRMMDIARERSGDPWEA